MLVYFSGTLTNTRQRYILKLHEDSMAPAGRPFQMHFWSPDQRPTMRIDGGDREFLIEPLYTITAKV